LIALKHSPELHLIAGDMQEIGINNEPITQSVLAKHKQLKQFQSNQSLPIRNALAELVNKNFIPTGTVLVKRSTLIEAGLFNSAIHFGEDLELWAKIASKRAITCLPEILMLRRLHGQNATTCTMPMLLDLVKVMLSIRQYSNDILVTQNINADKLVANAWANLGYGYFMNEDYQQAKSAFSNSLKEKLNKRALTYFIACVLPTKIIKTIRNTKQTLSN